MDELITKLVKKGQPLTHIYAEHEKELPVGLRSLYNYIDSGNMTIKNIDLRRKTSYKQRRANKKGVPKGFKDQSYREGRTYEDYEADMKFYSEYSVTEMDTVKGRRERGKRLLTMILRKNSIMLMFLMPDGTAASVKRVFDYLEAGLGTECFRRIFEIILTDNGGEFKKVDQLELNEDYEYRTRIYYCDPMASWQKPHIEKNHEYIRYVIPQGASFNAYTEEDMTLLMNHINSTRRVSLGGKAPYELITEDDEDMWALWRLLKMDLIPPDEVHLKPDLFAINK
jgi:IS30 family transposase